MTVINVFPARTYKPQSRTENPCVGASNNFVEEGLLGTFIVDVEPICDLELKSYNLISQTRVGRTVFDYVFTVTLHNSTSVALSNVEFELLGTPANMTILVSNVRFTQIPAGQSETSDGVLIVRIDNSTPTNLYDLPWHVIFEAGKLIGDITGDGNVDWYDLARLADRWLWKGIPGSIDEDILQDGILDFLDLAKLAGDWMSSLD